MIVQAILCKSVTVEIPIGNHLFDAGVLGQFAMNAETRIFEKYKSIGVKRGRECLLRHADALCFIEDCQRLGLTIVGMDFYKQEGDDIIELPSSADYSSLSRKEEAVERSIVAARRLLKDRLPEHATWVSFTVEEQRTHRGRSIRLNPHRFADSRRAAMKRKLLACIQ
jgi:hypothetical protein